MMRQRSGWIEPFHHYFEGNVLMLIGRKAAAANLGQQFGERGITVHIHP